MGEDLTVEYYEEKYDGDIMEIMHVNLTVIVCEMTEVVERIEREWMVLVRSCVRGG